MRFKNFAFFHEDFSSGHLFEAAAAHYQATGKKTLLTVATRLADLFDNEFGPGRQDYVAGHEGIELALVRLSRMTGEKRYLELAKAMPDRRGQKPSIFERQFKQLDRDRTMIYALEQADNAVSLRDIVLPASATFQSRFDPAWRAASSS